MGRKCNDHSLRTLLSLKKEQAVLLLSINYELYNTRQ
jgi:hypothetical protein